MEQCILSQILSYYISHTYFLKRECLGGCLRHYYSVRFLLFYIFPILKGYYNQWSFYFIIFLTIQCIFFLLVIQCIVWEKYWSLVFFFLSLNLYVHWEKNLEEGIQINCKVMGNLFSFWSVFVGYFPTIKILLHVIKSCLESMCRELLKIFLQ